MECKNKSTSSSHTSSNEVILKEVIIYNNYVSDCMNQKNKIDTWTIQYKNIQYPIVATANNSEFVLKSRTRAKNIGYEQFNCKQCADNCFNICHLFGKNDYILCRHSRLTTKYSTELSSIASDIYQKCIHDYTKFTISMESYLKKQMRWFCYNL